MVEKGASDLHLDGRPSARAPRSTAGCRNVKPPLADADPRRRR